ncbi:MAG: DUF6515 family protein [Bacteroidota bacterium]
MKSLQLILLILPLTFLLPTEMAEAQVRRKRTVVVTTKANNRQIRRQTRRQVRRVRRRNRFRALGTLPVGTRAVVYGSLNYYPVNGAYYVRQNGMYVRRLPPRGFRVARLTGRWVRLSVRNRNYVFSEGIFYREAENGFEVVEAPKGAVLEELPTDVEEMLLEDMTVYELYDVLYVETQSGYEVFGELGDLED